MEFESEILPAGNPDSGKKQRALGEAERYTREADRKRGGKRAVTKLDEHRKNKTPQTAPVRLGKIQKTDVNSRG